MKDYAKTIKQSKEIHGQQQGRQTLTKSAVQTNKTIEREKKNTESGRGFFSLVALFILIAVLFAVYRQYIRHRTEVNSAAHPATMQQSRPAQPATPQFDFYTVLPNGSTTGGQSASGTNPSSVAANTPGATSNSAATNTSAATGTATGTTPDSASTTITTVPVANASTANPAQTTLPVNTTTTSSSGQYYLNAGGFANSADAQQMLSQLLLLGVQANIQTSQDNGAPSYEILVGPFADQDTMNIVKAQLAAHQIQAAVVQN